MADLEQHGGRDSLLRIVGNAENKENEDTNAATPWAHFYKHGLTLIPAWISNHTPSNVWDGITYPFLNFNGCTVEV